MLPIIICDDDNRYRNYLEEIIRKCIFIEELDMEVALSSDCAGKVLQYIKENQAPFLYFLDVDLKDMVFTGITLAQKIREFDPRGFIVFVTVHEEMSFMTFQYQVEAMDYILKDYPEKIPERIKQCLFHAQDLFSSQNNTTHKALKINLGGRVLLIKQEEIICVRTSSNAHKIKIFTVKGIYEIAGGLVEIKKQLDDQFMLCHKSCIINLKYLEQLDKKERKAYMSNHLVCPVSFRQISKLGAKLDENCKKEK